MAIDREIQGTYEEDGVTYSFNKIGQTVETSSPEGNYEINDDGTAWVLKGARRSDVPLNAVMVDDADIEDEDRRGLIQEIFDWQFMEQKVADPYVVAAIVIDNLGWVPRAAFSNALDELREARKEIERLKGK